MNKNDKQEIYIKKLNIPEDIFSTSYINNGFTFTTTPSNNLK